MGAYVQNVMMTPSLSTDSDHSSASSSMSSKSGSGSGSVHYGPGAGSGGSGPGSAPQPGFFHRQVFRPLCLSYVGGQTKELFLDIGERTDVPQVNTKLDI